MTEIIVAKPGGRLLISEAFQHLAEDVEAPMRSASRFDCSFVKSPLHSMEFFPTFRNKQGSKLCLWALGTIRSFPRTMVD